MILQHWKRFRERVGVRWPIETLHMRRLVGRFLDSRRTRPAPSPDKDSIGIVVLPWSGSAVPWFSIACGLLLAERGHSVSFIVDDLPFGPQSRAWRTQLAGIRSIARVLGRGFPVHMLSRSEDGAAPAQEPSQRVRELALLNSVWSSRGESGVQREALEAMSSQLQRAEAAIGRFMQAHAHDALFVPGGVWGSSGLWVAAAKQRGVRVSTYDSGGYGTLLLSRDGIACQLQDIPRAFELLQQDLLAGGTAEAVHEAAHAEMAKRKSGTDAFSSQLAREGDEEKRFAGCMLVALNSSWDSAALGLHAAYDSTREWLIDTVRTLLQQTEAPVVVRQHPVERLEIARSVDDYRRMLHEEFGSHPRLHFIAATDRVNSYGLLAAARAVVVYTSTVGVEAAAQGKVVITESRSYYADLGFVHAASSVASYRHLLLQAAKGQLPTTHAMREQALRCYYITQCCNWIFTPFTVPGFSEWATLDVQRLEELPNVSLVADAIGKNLPPAFLQHQLRQRKSKPLSHAS